jgi:hypothetical protein
VIYSAKLDLNARITTVTVFLIAGTVAFFMVRAAADEPLLAKVLVSSVAALVLGLPAVAYLYRPLHYELTEDAFIVKRKLASVVIRLSDIVRVDYLNPAFLQDLKRTGGNGGVFGYYGEFTAGRDIYTLYTTQGKNMILIMTQDGDRLVISPDDLGIVPRLRSRIGAPSNFA